MPPRRAHVRLDVARLVSTGVIALLVAVVSYLQVTRPEVGFGDAGVFALGAAAIGAVTMAVANAMHTRAERRGVSAQPADSAWALLSELDSRLTVRRAR